MKKSTLLLGIIVLVVFVFASCSTTPENYSAAMTDDLPDRDYAAVVVSDLEGKKETAAFVTGAGKALGTQKIIPDVPDQISGLITDAVTPSSDNAVGPWTKQVVDLASKAFEFDTLVITHTLPTTQQVKFLGIPIRTQDVTAVYSLAIDVEENKAIGVAHEYVMYNEKAGVGAYTTAGNKGLSALLQASSE